MTHMLSECDPEIADLQEAEASHSLIFITAGGSTVESWAGRLQELHIPEYHVYDRDTNDGPSHYQETEDKINAMDRCRAFHLSKRELENYIHPAAISRAYKNRYGISLPVPSEFSSTDDVPTIIIDLLKKYKTDHPHENVPFNKVKAFINEFAVREMTYREFLEVDQDHDLMKHFRAVSALLKDAD